jgi:hypothetical protein
MHRERGEREGRVFSREEVDVENYAEEGGLFDRRVADYAGEVFGYGDGGRGPGC